MIVVRWRALLAALPILIAPAILRAQAPPERELVGLTFQGNEAFSDKELGAAIVNKATTCKTFLFKFPLPLCPLTDWGIAHNRRYLSEKELPLDVLRLRVFYRQRGYRQVAVDTVMDHSKGVVRVQFVIEENEPTRVVSLRIEGLSGLPDSAALASRLSLKEGDPFDILTLQRGTQAIENQLRNIGYVNAAVLDEYFIPEGVREAQLVVTVVTGDRARIASVRIEGMEKVEEALARQFLSFRTGEYYSEEKIRGSQLGLLDVAAFRFASIEAQVREDPDTLVDVTVRITEANLRAFRTGVGMSTTQCGVLEGDFAHRNLFGGGRLLTISGRLGNIGAQALDGSFPCGQVGDSEVFRQLTYRIQADFDQPYFISERNRLLGSIFFERESVPNIFVSTSLGAAIGITRRLNPRLTVTYSYRPQLTSFDPESTDIFFCANFGICDPTDISILTEPRWLSPIVFQWLYDRTDSRLNPTSGYRLSPQAEFAAAFTGSEYRYVRFALNAAAFQRLNPDWIFAFHLRGGFVEPSGSITFGGEEEASDEIVNPAKRFYGGGANSVRGFTQNLLGPTVLVMDSVTQCPDTPLQACAFALADTAANRFDERPRGGNALIEGSLELRYRISPRWGMVAFLDWGNVYADLTSFEDLPSATPGLGVRFSSPIGPIRLDLGYNTLGPRLRQVVAELEDGSLDELELPVVYDPAGFDDPDLFTEIFRRLRIHFAIGQAF